MIWVLSSFLDNIAAALIGGAMAHQLFRARVHIGYLAAIVAASNAGGAWSVVGDTTTLMPVEKLPRPSWVTALQLGFLSAVFDNIPLTALALKQGGYDWGFVAYAVGFGGSMIWFGSSAGVALSNLFPEARSVTKWLRHGLHIAVAYVIGFFAMLAVWNWHPDAPPAAGEVKAERSAERSIAQGTPNF